MIKSFRHLILVVGLLLSFQAFSQDTDSDGISDSFDNCADDSNPNQEDSDLISPTIISVVSISSSGEYSNAYQDDNVTQNNGRWLLPDYQIPGWIQFDLGATKLVSKLEVRNTTNNGINDRGTANYSIYGSLTDNDLNEKSTSIFLADGTLTWNNTQLQTVTTIPRKVRYIRFWVDSNWGTYGGGLRQVIIYESTSDGYGDACDNCPDVFNTDQADFDNDGDGDACDTDDDNDGTLDTDDAFPLNPNEDTDTDSDGIGNNADTDDDGDGTLDTDDDFPSDPTEDTDTDGDGTGNNADTDDDNDGISDADEDSTGTDPLDTDTDDDGTLDPDDTFPLDPNEDTDSDEDGVGDNADADDDNDSFGDVDEISAGSDPLSALSVPNDFIDSDGDGIGDSQDNCPSESNADQADSDALAISNETNIAAGKTTSARSTYSTSFPSSKIVDGYTADGSGYWLAGNGLSDQWVQVDLGTEYQISRIQWFNTSNGSFNDRGVYTYRIVGSSSNDNWSLPSQVVTLSQGEVEKGNNSTTPYVVNISPTKTVRYIRFYCDDVRTGSAGVGLNELQVFELKSDGGDLCDNCPDIYNLDQSDVDGDGYGDVCDAFVNDNTEWLDTDGDGTGNNEDTDDDNDGLLDAFEEAQGTDPLDATSYTEGSITITEAFTDFQACFGFVSSEQSFTVEAFAITGDLVLQAPVNFEISLTSGTSFTRSITLSPEINQVNSTSIYIRSISAPITGQYTSDLTASSSKAPTNEAFSESITMASNIQLAGKTLTLGYNQESNYTNTPNYGNIDVIKWVEWSSITGTTGTGTLPSGQTINGVETEGTSVSLSHSVGGMSETGTYNHSTYPDDFNVPENNGIRNEKAGIFTIDFGSAVTNPQIALGSIGSASITVPIRTNIPYQVLWAGQDVTYNPPYDLTGNEGFTIISFPGSYTSIQFEYLQDEVWVNILVGAESLESPDVNICEAEEVTLNASGSPNASFYWTADVSGPNSGLPDNPTGATLTVNPFVTTTYSVTDLNDFCGASKSITVIVPNENPVAIAKESFTVILDDNGEGTITVDQIDDGSNDNCKIESMSIDITEFNCDNIGENTVTLTVIDVLGNTVTDQTIVTVTTNNEAPTVTYVSTSTDEDTAVEITLDGSDSNICDTLTYAASQPSNGTVSLDGAVATYTPNANYNGADTFTYIANDGTVDSDPATVTITIAAVNDAPTADDQSVDAVEQTEKIITISGTDIEDDALLYIVSSLPSNGTLSEGETAITSEDLPKTLLGTDLKYISTSDTATSDSFTFKTNDGELDSDSATVTITIAAVNDAPTVTDISESTDEDTAVAISLAGTDVDGDALTFATSQASNGTVSLDGTVATYTPNANFNGTDTFTYTANDGTVDSDPATVTITIAAVNDAPTITDVSESTDEDTAVAITLTGTDIDGDALTFTTSQGSNGTVNVVGAVVTYTPNANFNGTDTFTYTANDGTVNSEPATVTITVIPDIASTEISAITDQIYTGNALTPTPIIIFNSTTLVETIDYTLSYFNNINAGTASLTIRGIGNFTGEKTIGFTILKADPSLSFSDITKTYGDVDFDLSATSSSAVTITYSITDTTIATLSGTKVSILKSGATIVSASQIANSNFNSATATITLTVSPANIASTTISAISDQTYTGSALTPTTTITFNSTRLIETIDYTLGYLFNTNAGTASLTIRGIGNFTGEKTIGFTISKADPSFSISDITKTYGDDNFTISASSSSTADKVITIDNQNIVSLVPGTLNELVIKQAGVTEFTITQPSTVNYLSASATGTITINKKDPDLGSFGPFETTYGDPPFQIDMSSLAVNENHTSSYVFTTSSSTIAIISGSSIIVNQAGESIITATLAGDTNYNAGSISTSLTVAKALAEITVTGLPQTQPLKNFDTLALSATTNASTSVQMALEPGSAATLSGTLDNYELVSIGDTGVVTITFTVPETINYSSASLTLSMDVTKSNQEINLPSDFPSQLTFSEPLTLDLSTVSATSSLTVGIAIATSSSATYQLSSQELSITHPGVLQFTFSQPGDQTYNQAVDVIKTLTVIKGETTLTNFGAISANSTASPISIPPPTSNRSGAFIYESADVNTAIISGTTIIITGTGSTTITATQPANSKYNAATISTTLTIGKSDPALNFSDLTKTYGDEDFNLLATSNSTGAITYSIADNTVATVSATIVQILNAGATIVSASQAANTNFNSATATMTLTVNPASVVSTTLASLADQTYTGNAIRISPTVTFNNITLVQNTDYSVSYQNNTNVGSATIEITGIGNYTGTTSTSFKILALDLSNAIISTVASQSYTGNPIAPNPSVVLNSTTLTKDVDYTITYSNNIEAGTAGILVTGIGNYTGSKSTNFLIVKEEEEDTDQDGVPDSQDAFPLDPNEDTDTDGDGTGDNADADDDNDGISDLDENQLGTNPLNTDSDGDGTNDQEDAFPLDSSEDTDTDGDGIGNNVDQDDDNDGILDQEDESPLTSNQESNSNDSSNTTTETIESSSSSTTINVTGEDVTTTTQTNSDTTVNTTTTSSGTVSTANESASGTTSSTATGQEITVTTETSSDTTVNTTTTSSGTVSTANESASGTTSSTATGQEITVTTETSSNTTVNTTTTSSGTVSTANESASGTTSSTATGQEITVTTETSSDTTVNTTTTSSGTVSTANESASGTTSSTATGQEITVTTETSSDTTVNTTTTSSGTVSTANESASGTTSSTATGQEITVTTETSSDTTVNTTTTSSGTVSTEQDTPSGTTSSTATGQEITVTTETSSNTTVNTTTTSSGTVSTEQDTPSGTTSSTATGQEITVTTETSSDTTVNTTTTSSGTVSTEQDTPSGTTSSTATGQEITVTTETSSNTTVNTTTTSSGTVSTANESASGTTSSTATGQEITVTTETSSDTTVNTTTTSSGTVSTANESASGTTSSTATGQEITVTTETSSDTTVNTTTTSSGTVSTANESASGTTSSTATGQEITVTTETSSNTTVNTTTTSSGTVSTANESASGTTSSTATGQEITVTTETSSDTTVNTTTTSSGTVSTEQDTPSGTTSSTATGQEITVTTETSSDSFSTEASLNDGSLIVVISQVENPTSETITVTIQGENITYTAIDSASDQTTNLIFTSTGSITITRGEEELSFYSETILINIASGQIIVLSDDQDSDQDNYSDLDEILNGTGVNNPLDIPNDSDNDNLSDVLELYLGTDPEDDDSDGDGTNDGEDVFPLNPNEDSDSDGDGIGDNEDPFNNLERENFPNQQVNFGISPNGDGLNDTLELDFLLDSFKNDLSIYDSFGRRVYYAENYMLTSDRFEGRNQRNRNLLPQGTYFFILNSEGFEGEKQKLQGFIYVNY